MYFKSAVILYVLYFINMIQSIGIDGNQINNIKKLYNKLVKDIKHLSKENMENMGRSIGMSNDNMLEFDFQEDVSNARKLLDFLLFVANYDKQKDNLESIGISSYEARLYLGLFRDIDQTGNHDGLLGHADVEKVIGALDLKNWSSSFSLTRSVNDRLLYLLTKGPKINALEFIDGIWGVKPLGNGLDQKQVEELVYFHISNIIDGHIDADAVTQFFKNLCIVKSDYRGQFAFGSKRNSFLELQELLLVLTEYSKVEKTGTVYSTISVRYILSIFSKRDTDKDGLLNKDDVSNIASSYPRTLNQEKIDYYMLENDINNDNHLDIAEFFLTLFKEDVNLSFFR